MPGVPLEILPETLLKNDSDKNTLCTLLFSPELVYRDGLHREEALFWMILVAVGNFLNLFLKSVNIVAIKPALRTTEHMISWKLHILSICVAEATLEAQNFFHRANFFDAVNKAPI